MELNIEQVLQDSLIAHKFLVSMYCTYSLECSNKPLRSLLAKYHDLTANQNFQIFQIMHELNLYPIIPATTKDISKAIKKHSQMQADLEKNLEEKSK